MLVEGEEVCDIDCPNHLKRRPVGDSQTNGSMVQWGGSASRTQEAPGTPTTWGSTPARRACALFRLYTGTGDYAGLSYFMWTAAFGTTWPTHGLIFPGTAPMP